MNSSRRRLLSFVASSGVIGVAGCINTDSDTTSTDPSSDDSSPATPSMTPDGKTETPTTTENPGTDNTTLLIANDGDKRDKFGSGVAVSNDGTTVIVGAADDDNPRTADTNYSSGAGAAYVFQRTDNTWTQQAKLAPKSGGYFNFGRSVAVSASGTLVCIGSYIFSQTDGKWSQTNNLERVAGVKQKSIADLSDDESTVLLGTQVLTRSGSDWVKQTTLAPATAKYDEGFGTSRTLNSDGSIAMIGANATNTNDPNEGVYVFSQAGGSWREQAVLTDGDGDGTDDFGASVAVSGDGSTAIVGAPSDEGADGGSGGGAAYIFARAGGEWEQQTKLIGSDTDAWDAFGSAVTLSHDGTVALVGTPRPNEGPSGVAFRFVKTGQGWKRQMTYPVSGDGERSDDRFGQALDLDRDGTHALIGAPLASNSNGTRAGSAYLYWT